ncbi:hypothetical protein TrCOL_g11600 [Triparma columacea]|uniref:Adenylate kinase active site lid domain-containing protein n=1 Tax=Triparma columacea TaxID=722753 RepID=A0A9W7L9X7_9STRA|nr:hypothetical protein TrCOL_g11600 [Triparma columacea]
MISSIRALGSKIPLAKNVRHATYLILGKPGGGKGTISKKILASHEGFVHISTGDILREEVNKGSEIGLKAKGIMESGGLLPDDLMVDLVSTSISSLPSPPKHLLLDGFPRTMPQAVALDAVVPVEHVISLDIPNSVIVERTSDRWLSPSTNRVYSYSYQPPKVHGKCDDTGEDLIQRDDDKPESVLKRLETYDEMTKPLNDYYSEKGILQGFDGETSDVIFKKVTKWLDGH